MEERHSADSAVMMLDISDIAAEANVYDDFEKRWRHERWTDRFNMVPRFLVFVRDRIRTALRPDIDFNPMTELNVNDMTGNPGLSARGS